jgi:iron complex transport system substrate-binding protein
MTRIVHSREAARFSLTAFLIAAAVVLCVPAGPAKATDASYPEAESIVSIGGAITEILFALGVEDRITARDSTSTYPPSAIELPDVGYMRALSPEGVISAGPDLILMQEDSGPPEAVDAIKAAGIPVVSVPDAYTAQGIAQKIRTVGSAIGESAKADDLAGRIALQLQQRAAQARERQHKKRVLFIISMQGGKVMASGSNTAAAAMIELAGGQNVVTAYSGYKQMTDEAVIDAAPDVILMMDRRGNHDFDAETLFGHPAIATTPAAKSHNVVRMDGLYLLGFGPRTADAIADLAKRLYP